MIHADLSQVDVYIDCSIGKTFALTEWILERGLGIKGVFLY